MSSKLTLMESEKTNPFSLFAPETSHGCRLSSWEVKEGEGVTKGTVLAKLEDFFNSKLYPVVAPEDGVIKKRLLLSLSEKVDHFRPICTFFRCDHAVVYGGCCASGCGADMSNAKTTTGPKVILANPLIQMTPDHARKLENENVNRLQNQKKLALVLDLDNTLLHACTEEIIRVPEPFKKKSFYLNPEHHAYSFQLPGSKLRYFVKFRPGLFKMLEELSTKYEMHIYTMGTRPYALKIAELMDPQKKYFREENIISRDDYPHGEDMSYKNLQRIFPCNDTMVVILDDRADVWRNTKNEVVRNLIHVHPYQYFSLVHEMNYVHVTGNQKDKKQKDSVSVGSEKETVISIIGEDKTEMSDPDEAVINLTAKEDRDTYLFDIHRVLERLHTRFYENNAQETPSVIDILTKFRDSVLKGTQIVFSGIFPTNMNAESTDIWRTAKSFGAKCANNISNKTTHVIAANSGTEKVRQGREKNLWIVKSDWLFDCAWRWRKVDEFSFPIQSNFPAKLEESDDAEEAEPQPEITKSPKKPKLEDNINDQKQESPADFDLDAEIAACFD